MSRVKKHKEIIPVKVQIAVAYRVEGRAMIGRGHREGVSGKALLLNLLLRNISGLS